ncbi:MAG: LytTR family DNA-binding domain-containing protein [Spirosomataceae bacterium]
MKCAIVDDEYLAIQLLTTHVKKIPSLELVGAFQRATDVLPILSKGEVDLLFLDIQMPELTGIELIKTLQYKPFIVLTTAYSEYALAGYELDITDYLLKPITFERCIKAVNKVYELWQLKHHNKSQTPNEPSVEKVKNYLMVKADGRLVKVLFDDILYIEGLKEYVSIYTPSQRIITLERLSNLEALLPADQFVRCHKSYIAALPKVSAVDGNQLEIAKKLIPIGLSYKDEVLKRL